MNKFVKKIVASALLMCLGFNFAACSSSSELTVEKGVLTMATNAAFPPYEYWENNAIVGIDAEIAQEIANRLNLTLKIEDVSFDSLITGVQSNKYDIAVAGMTVTDERKLSVSFSDSYATGIQSIIVTEDSPITDIDALIDGDYIVGVQIATTGDIYMSDDIGMDRVEQYNNGADATQALITGKIDAVVIDNQPALAFVAANPGLKILETPYTIEDYAIAVNKNNEELLNQINKALSEMKADGTIDAIINKYIPA
ncbi:MAG: transporter substrate-binding domain-containing protein [Clostridia bacterium]|nr:transporter substrate-binding domain-containing protein [Clostridia bacterium]